MSKFSPCAINSLKQNINFIKRLSVRECSSNANSLASVDDEELQPDRKLDFEVQRLHKRGYLRSQRPYDPPKEVVSLVTDVCLKFKDGIQDGCFTDGLVKYKVLNECNKILDYRVPNSVLHKIKSTDDLLAFYTTPIDTTVPLEQMKDMDLPKNLHVLYDYVRFHPETDTKFNGVSAFPENSTIIVNLKSKKKFAGYNAKKKSLPF